MESALANIITLHPYVLSPSISLHLFFGLPIGDLYPCSFDQFFLVYSIYVLLPLQYTLLNVFHSVISRNAFPLRQCFSRYSSQYFHFSRFQHPLCFCGCDINLIIDSYFGFDSSILCCLNILLLLLLSLFDFWPLQLPHSPILIRLKSRGLKKSPYLIAFSIGIGSFCSPETFTLILLSF